MPLPSELLQQIEASVEHVLQDGNLNPQQLTFVHHIQKMAGELSLALSHIPQTEYALNRIIPGFGDSFLQQQVALFGYARLLLEKPESFGDAVLSEYQRDEIQRIYQHGQALYQLTEQIMASAQSERLEQHNALPDEIVLDALLSDEAPVLQYLLRDVPVQLSIEHGPVMVVANAYHLRALIQHIVTTLALELIEYGRIKINTGKNHQDVSLNIFCTGIQLDAREIDILFKKNGRYLYPQRLEKEGGAIRFFRESGRGAIIQLILSSIKR